MAHTTLVKVGRWYARKYREASYRKDAAEHEGTKDLSEMELGNAFADERDAKDEMADAMRIVTVEQIMEAFA
ncbi:hypothetical protein PQ472_05040 [Lacticaseibacillus pabuli]|uniref:Uncharacterized protein n=1 Tax=Lacticaseibacillus pabuli TaxID=3025672 RepID=A0ABY7WXC2_9LACO|nr:hypothetical protein [Lacticaseibacillus sp. KACC 23028]WDF83602.1 hypothetical protein PQ472_05040 [Lacticaseibacillus sp. KACC 23028]